MLRSAGRAIRLSVISILLFGSVVTAVAGVLTIADRRSKAHYAGTSFRWNAGFYGEWDFVVYLNRFRDTSLTISGRNYALSLSAMFKLDPENAKQVLVWNRIGDFQLGYNSKPLYLTCGMGQNEWWEKASPEERARAQLLTASAWIGAPFWFPAPFFAAYPLWAFVRGPWRRRRRRAKGLCIRCGYDLTGNVAGVCSECGTEIQKAKSGKRKTESSNAETDER